MFPTTLVKFVTSTVVSIGVSKIVGNAIKATTPADLKTYERICIRVGKYALAGACASFAAKHVESQIEDLAEAFNGTKSFSDAMKKAWAEGVDHEPVKDGDTHVTVDITTTPRKDASQDDKDDKARAEATEELVDESKDARFNSFEAENQS